MTFVKGQSGNPSGRAPLPPEHAQFIALAREASLDAMRFIIAVTKDEKARPQDRLTAARIIIERGWGLPAQDKSDAAVVAAHGNIVVNFKVRQSTAPPVPDAPVEDDDDDVT